MQRHLSREGNDHIISNAISVRYPIKKAIEFISGFLRNFYRKGNINILYCSNEFFFYNIVDIPYPEESLLRHNPLSSPSSSMKSLFIMLLPIPSIPCSLGFLFILVSSAFHSRIIFVVVVTVIITNFDSLCISWEEYIYNFRERSF